MTVEELAIYIAQLSPEHRKQLVEIVAEAVNAHVQSKTVFYKLNLSYLVS